MIHKLSTYIPLHSPTQIPCRIRFQSLQKVKSPRQRSTSFYDTPSTTRSKGGSTTFPGRLRPSPTSLDISTKDDWLYKCRRPSSFKPMSFSLLLDKTQWITPYFTVLASGKGTKRQSDNTTVITSRSMHTYETLPHPQRFQ